MKRNKNNSGFTLAELFLLMWFVFCIALFGGAIYAACHFTAKFW